MKPPTKAEVQAYIDEKNYNLDAESFWLFYDSKGWVVGKAPMKQWKSAAGLWAHNGWGQSPQSKARLAKQNVQVAQDLREHQRDMYQDFLSGKTVAALKDLKRDPGAMGHVLWLIEEILTQKL